MEYFPNKLFGATYPANYFSSDLAVQSGHMICSTIGIKRCKEGQAFDLISAACKQIDVHHSHSLNYLLLSPDLIPTVLTHLEAVRRLPLCDVSNRPIGPCLRLQLAHPLVRRCHATLRYTVWESRLITVVHSSSLALFLQAFEALRSVPALKLDQHSCLSVSA